MRTEKWKMRIAVLCLLAGVVSRCPAKVIYVDDDAGGANDGTSWEDAYFYLQDALMFAVTGDEIRVAQGVYRPDAFVLSDRPNLGREETFQLIDGVTVEGGYAGIGQPDPNARDVELYESILSGDRDGNDANVADPCDLFDEPSRGENSYHVVTAVDTGESAVLDGFVIKGGNADKAHPSPDAVGGGMHIDGGRPFVANCTFLTNSARSGGGAGGVNSSAPSFMKCIFEDSFAVDRGGGLAATSPLLVECTFIGNAASYAGGLHAFSGSVSNCTFLGNSALAGGGAMQSTWTHITDCDFSENTALKGGAIWFPDEDSNTIIRRSIFNHNSATSIGGGADIYGNHTFEGCEFVGNIARDGGGASLPDGARPIFTGCIFKGNSAEDAGGALYSESSNGQFVDCTISGNSAHRGGGIYSYGSGTVLTQCSLSGNWARYGGVMYNEMSDPTVKNCLLAGNLAGYGGGIYNEEESEPIFVNCTFSGNAAHYDPNEEFGGDGGAICNWGGSRPTITNCILWANSPDQVSGDHAKADYCCIQDWTNDIGGVGNIDADPCFADYGYWDVNGTAEDANDDFWVDGDYHLKSQGGRWDSDEGRWTMDDVTSVCIDAGDPMSPIGLEPFPNGGVVNMGAYGGTAEASKSYFGDPACETIVAGDINGDCAVDFLDFCLMALRWMEQSNP